MSPWRCESIKDGPRNLPLKFHQNRVSNSWDIADIEFVWGGVGGVESFYCQTQPLLNLNNANEVQRFEFFLYSNQTDYEEVKTKLLS